MLIMKTTPAGLVVEDPQEFTYVNLLFLRQKENWLTVREGEFTVKAINGNYTYRRVAGGLDEEDGKVYLFQRVI